MARVSGKVSLGFRRLIIANILSRARKEVSFEGLNFSLQQI